MSRPQSLSLIEHLRVLPHPRVERTRHHELLDIMVIAICAVISSAETWEDVAAFGHAKHDWFQRFLNLPHGIPSHDTFNRVFARLDPQAFQDCFLGWMRAVSTELDIEQIA